MAGTLAKTSKQAQAETLGVTLGEVETRIVVKTLAFKLAEALVDTLPYTQEDVEATTLQDPLGGV